jgi:hypothetical protein
MYRKTESRHVSNYSFTSPLDLSRRVAIRRRLIESKRRTEQSQESQAINTTQSIRNTVSTISRPINNDENNSLISNIADNNNNKMIAIKAPIDTSIEIIDNKNIENVKENIGNVFNDDKEILDNFKKENQIFMESKNGEISVYVIFNNERENSINYNNENNNIDLDYEQNYSNNLFGFENSGKSNKYLSNFTNYNNYFNGYNQVLSQNKNEKNILMKEYSYKNYNFNP